MARLRNFLIGACVTAFLVCGSLIPPGLADGGANHQKQNNNYGVSGGNINDVSRAFCCSGTLGSLVTDGSTKYILSNNHVLGRSDQAVAGEDISQPGLIDNSCRVPRIVADFTIAVPLGQNVDAAIAALRSGTMNTQGTIEDIGTISSTVLSPSVGLSVAKSGRTTGFTTGSISSINTSVNVQYQKNCGSGKKFVISYTNQVVIDSSTFSAGGDSGSLIVSNGSSCHQPVALLYAGSSSSTIGNPIGEVISRLSATLGRSLSFVGGTCSAAPVTSSSQEIIPFIRGRGQQMRELPAQAAARATAVLELHRANLMFQPGVIGAGVGAASDDNVDAAIVIYVDRTSNERPVLADSIDGIPVRVVLTDPFVAF
jgi:hypothetical protein